MTKIMFSHFPKHPLFLAPMADVTNPAFRMLCHEKGADFTLTEMINAAGFLSDDPSAMERGISLDQKPYGIQIVGPSANSILKAALGLEEKLHPSVIDINMGCPSPKILKDKCGAYLLNDMSVPPAIISTLSENLKTPVTAKIRVFRDEEKTISLAESLEDAGAFWLSVHARTAAQGYSGKANWEIVKKIKENLSIPVILNGDIFKPDDLKKAIETDCDGFMIGRGAIGNPAVFERMKESLSGKDFEIDPGEEFRQRISDFKRYCFLLDKYNLYSHVNIKSHAQWFTKGLLNSREMRLEIAGLQKETRLRHLSEDEIADSRRVLAEKIVEVFEKYFGC
ncbi:tRNA-dihydrouridine synthase family protein [Methanolapillus millepedarum]|uniref:tRNA-dihydrouridine synthase n=1 Tax=Methanolapillus millepedarum TaxID=3028296 RepID=A0AA96V341_9EURY|nr:putative tRNA-dihydrouridine synthase [Methanosarcinaceae archaeon Ac7]